MKTSTINRWFYLFISLHLLAWTLAPTLVRFVLPMDAIEGCIWGHQLEWGYDKNPFLNAWLTALALYLGNGHDWVVYLFCQLSIVLCFWAVWKLANKILSPLQALLAVMLLEGVQYFNLHALDFNDNVLELSTWALTIWFFYQALQDSRYYHWIFTGIFAALALMTKYYSIVLLIPMFLFIVIYARQQFKNPAFYLSFFIFLLMILPHVIWLISHDFTTLHYAVDRVSSPPTWQNHLIYPWQFFQQQLQVIIPSVILLMLAFPRMRPTLKPGLQDAPFLLFMAFGPFLLTLLISAIGGLKLRASWGQPLLSLWGILLIAWLRPQLTTARFYRFLALFYVLLVLLVGIYCRALLLAEKPSSANYPGKILAKTFTKEWRDRYHTPLHYIAGSRLASGNIALYSSDRPSVYIDWNTRFSPWIDEHQLRQHGAIFIWEADEAKQTSPEDVKKRFPNLGPLEIRHFTWMRNKTMAPVEISVAFLPPASVD